MRTMMRCGIMELTRGEGGPWEGYGCLLRSLSECMSMCGGVASQPA